ncbi:extracellular solute-binding protein [Haematomicrobium sanguinis]|uniref:extracellular solute-binding protein n=1 Tax=Haematomicrobium sanguinis TaxID=479106 RepID=UPI00047CEBDF|nr:extracellular solute-binding protein [Haematomicrobium sanguinis]
MKINTTIENGVTRRKALFGGLGLSALAVLGAGTLAGCGQRNNTVTSASSANLPNYTEPEGLQADLPGNDQGVPAGYLTYPKEPKQTVPEPFLNGATVTAMAASASAPPNQMDRNPVWQEINKRMGGTLELQSVPSSDYDQKLTTNIASGKLPDIFSYGGGDGATDFLKSECANLEEYLAGDKVKDYPNLAAIPEVFWRTGVFDGTLYLLPIPRPITGGAGFYNGTLFEKVGVPDISKVANADDFRSALKELSTGNNQWAIGGPNFVLSPFRLIFKLPNQWRYENGELTREYETEEYKRMVEYVIKLREDGSYVPGSEAWTKPQMISAFATGQVAMIYDGLPGWKGHAESFRVSGRNETLKCIIPFAYDGSDPIAHADNIVYSNVALKKNDPEKIKAALGVANFMAAPFGSAEYLLYTFGVEGQDYTMDENNNPVPSKGSDANTGVPWRYLAAPAPFLYSAAYPEDTKTLYEAYSTLIPMAIEDPTGNIESPTDVRQGGNLGESFRATVTDIIAGRKPFSEFDNAVKAWRNGGGDKIREEYLSALNAATPTS